VNCRDVTVISPANFTTLRHRRRRLGLRCDVTILIINPGMVLVSPEVDKFGELFYNGDWLSDPKPHSM
jgi:hypothetical protein